VKHVIATATAGKTKQEAGNNVTASATKQEQNKSIEYDKKLF